MTDTELLENLSKRKVLAMFDFHACFVFVPQQLEKLGGLPIKLRGGLGQPPETWNQIPQGSTLRFHSKKSRFPKVPLLKVLTKVQVP